jgi:hypothetical protein
VVTCSGGFEEKDCGGTGSKTANLILNECMEMHVNNYTNSWKPGSLGVRCNATGASKEGSITLTVNGTAKPYSWTNYSWNDLVDLGRTITGTNNDLGKVCLTSMTGATGVACTGPNN